MEDSVKDHNALITDGWFIAYVVMDGIYRISDHGNSNLYLVIGEKAAVLIDTGYGNSGLSNFINRLTSLPLTVVNSHGHFDHSFGNDQFDTVYIGRGDMPLLNYAEHDIMKEYIENVGSLIGDARALPFKNMWGVPARIENAFILDSMKFDLGGEVLNAHLVPGHSRGSVCFYAEKAGVLFVGDSYVPLEYWGPMWFHNENCAPLSDFYKSMSCLTDLKGIKYMLSGHRECGLLPISRLDTLLKGVERVIAGKEVGIPEETLIGTGMRIDWADVGIVYDPKNIQ